MSTEPQSQSPRFRRRADALLAGGMLDAAAEAYAELLDTDPEDAGALFGLTRLALGLGQGEDAAALLVRARDVDPRSAEGPLLEGLLAEGRGDIDGAADAYRLAVQADPSAFEPRLHLGRLLASRGEAGSGWVGEALPALERAVELRPDHAGAWYVLGVARARAGNDAGAAVDALALAVAVDPTFVDGYLTLADVLCAAGRRGAALEVLERARVVCPEAAAVLGKLAAVHLALGDLASAAAALRRRALLDPADADAHAHLVTVSLAASDPAGASSAADTFVDLHPGDWRGWWLRSKLFDMADRPARAVADLRRACDLAPGAWQPWNDLGTLLNARAAAGDGPAAKEAVEVLERAVATAPGGEDAPAYNLALALWNAGRTADAGSVFGEDPRPVADALHPSARTDELRASLAGAL